jgi:hypothetical protein
MSTRLSFESNTHNFGNSDPGTILSVDILRFLFIYWFDRILLEDFVCLKFLLKNSTHVYGLRDLFHDMNIIRISLHLFDKVFLLSEKPLTTATTYKVYMY